MAKEATTEGGEEQKAAPLDLNAPEIQEAINKAVKDATTGLAKNRDDLLAEKKQLAERAKLLDDLGGEDGVKKLREFQARMSKDEEGQLIAEGKIDEVVNRRVKTLLEQKTKREEALNAELEAAKKQSTDYQNRFRQSVLDNTVAQKVTGLNDGALDLVQQIARRLLHVTDDGKIEPREDVDIWKDGKPVSMDTLKDYLLETRDFLFKPSHGGAARPASGANGSAAKQMLRSNFEQLSHKERANFMRSGGRIVD